MSANAEVRLDAPAAPVLHLTNGDSTVESLEQTELGGDVAAWRDILHEGPVPAQLGPEELRAVRARFLAGLGGADAAVVEAELAARDALLTELGPREQVVLWFEHDLYDQLQLLQILDLVADADRGRVQLIGVGSFPGRPRFAGLGELTATELASLWPLREPVSEEQHALGRAGWAAFRDPDPTGVERVLAAGTAALPFLAAALRRHLEQFPWTGDGLARDERTMLRELARRGRATPVELFHAVSAAEEAPYMGDATVFRHLDELADGEAPLVHRPDGDGTLALTELGRDVVEGRADRLASAGLDRWLGGVHLQGRDVWRWDAAAARLVEPG